MLSGTLPPKETKLELWPTSAAHQSDSSTITDATVEEGVGDVSLLKVTNSTVARLTADANNFFGLVLSIASNNTVCDTTISETIAEPEPEPKSTVEAPPGEEGEPEVLEATGIIIDNALGNRIKDSTVTESGDWDVVVSNGATNNSITNLDLDSAVISLDGQDFTVRAVDEPLEEPDDLANVGGYIAAADRGENPPLELDVHCQDDDVADVGVD